MIRPKIDGFFAFRGPVETVEDKYVELFYLEVNVMPAIGN